MIRVHDGYAGMFTRDQAKGAWPNGTRVRKCATENGDTHAIGDTAVVLGSIDSGLPLHSPDPYFYFVEWDDMPGVAVGVISSKVVPL